MLLDKIDKIDKSELPVGLLLFLTIFFIVICINLIVICVV